MKRQRATDLAEQLLARLHAGRQEWPLSLVTEVYVFGSYARGAADPHDLDIEVEINRQDDRWMSHFITAMSYDSDPYLIIRRALVDRSRSCQFLFESRDRVDFPLTVLWRVGDSLEAAVARLHAMTVDEAAGRAPRDAMLPEFNGLDRWIPRTYRERLIDALDAGAIGLQRMELHDVDLDDPIGRRHLDERWGMASPLHRAGRAVLAWFAQRGIDLSTVHLHGRDVDGPVTPYFAGFGMRYFRHLPWCFTEHQGVEWVEVVHPTRTQPLHALRITPTNRDLLIGADWS